MLSRDQILEKRKPRIEEAALPDGSKVLVRVMTGAERDGYEAGNYTLGADGKAKLTLDNARARLVVRCLCDADGKRLFQDSDAAEVGKIDGVWLEAVVKECERINLLTKAAQEEERKLFPPSDGSGTDLPATSV